MNSIQGEKKVTFLINSLAGGGAEGVCVNIANGLIEKGWQVDLLVLHLHNAAYLQKVNGEVNIVNLNVLQSRYALNAVMKYIKVRKPERILVFNYELTVLLVLIRKLTFLKFKILARNINNLSQKKKLTESNWRRFIVNPLIDRFYCQADHVINQCQSMESDILALFPRLKGRTSVIYNPVNKIIEDAADRIDFNAIEKQEYLLCVGRLEKQKAFHYAIYAFYELSKELPSLRLKIVGQGRLESALRDLSLQLGISEKIDFEGFQTDIIPFYLHAKATLLTSLYEGFPNVLIESIYLRTPIVAFDCPSGPREIIEKTKYGRLAELHDVDGLVKALREIINFQYDYKVFDDFSNARIIKKYATILEAV